MADVSGRELAEYMEVDLCSLILSSSSDFSSFWHLLTTLSTGAALRLFLIHLPMNIITKHVKSYRGPISDNQPKVVTKLNTGIAYIQ